ncbi:MAG TPA: hypothetical protein VI731_07790 [Bacteroidia bacterium]|nr:hypothetical protein [Bacteroidia bacterium]
MSLTGKLKKNAAYVFTGICRSLLIHGAGGCLLCFAAFYNWFPLIYSDTGTYITSGFENFAPIDRPIIYGWFIRHSSLAASLWLTVLAQGMILSYLIYESIRTITTRSRPYILHFFVLGFLVLFTSISPVVSRLIPDVFAPVMMLCMFLLLFPEKRSVFTLGIISFFFLLSASSHTSHVFIGLLLLGSISIFLIVRRLRRRTLFVSRRGLLLTWSLFLIAVLIIPLTNLFYHNKFKMSIGAQAFYLQKLHEEGIIASYLNEYCGKRNYPLCDYNNRLPWDFLWDAESPLNKENDWEDKNGEYKRLISDILSTRAYAVKIAHKSLFNSAKIFFVFDEALNPAYDMESSPYAAMHRYFKDSGYEYLMARQQSNVLNHDRENFIQRFVIIGSLVIIAAALFAGRVRRKLSPLLAFTLLFFFTALISNAAVCGTLASMSPRFQSRIAWLLPFLVLMLMHYFLSGTILAQKIKSLFSKTAGDVQTKQ